GILGLPGSGFPKFNNLGSSTFGGVYNPASVTSNIGINNRGLLIGLKPTFVADLTWVRGNHTYKTGAEFKIDVLMNQAFAGLNGTFTFATAQTGLPSLAGVNLNGGAVGFGLASFMLGQYDSASIGNAQTPQYRRN